jgi:hypothetical protein
MQDIVVYYTVYVYKLPLVPPLLEGAAISLAVRNRPRGPRSRLIVYLYRDLY